jgi:hypothetical protein
METDQCFPLEEDHTQNPDRGPQIGSQSSYAFGLSFHAIAEEIWGSTETPRYHLAADAEKM